MALLDSIVKDVESVAGTVLASLAQTKTVQTLEQYSLDAILAVELKKTSIEIDGYTVSANWNNAPTALTLPAVFLAIDNIATGQTGVFQSGSISLSIEKTVTAAVPAAA